MMIKNEYTDKTFWEDYWKRHNPERIGKVFFEELVKDWPEGNKSFIEIGGFPGSYAAWFAREKNYNVSLLDYVILPDIVKCVEQVNELEYGAINIIEADFLKCAINEKYDIVFSSGFIEHFENTEDIIHRHLTLLKPGGKLLIVFPNFRGINGWVQKIFDRENFDAHNIKCMDVNLLKNICDKLNVQNTSINFFGKPVVWLERKHSVKKYTYLIIKYFSKVLSKIPVSNNAIFSPYIFIEGNV